LITRLRERAYKSRVKKIEEIKQLVEFRQYTNTALRGKCKRLSALPGTKEA